MVMLLARTVVGASVLAEILSVRAGNGVLVLGRVCHRAGLVPYDLLVLRKKLLDGIEVNSLDGAAGSAAAARRAGASGSSRRDAVGVGRRRRGCRR